MADLGSILRKVNNPVTIGHLQGILAEERAIQARKGRLPPNITFIRAAAAAGIEEAKNALAAAEAAAQAQARAQAPTPTPLASPVNPLHNKSNPARSKRGFFNRFIRGRSRRTRRNL